MRFGRKIATSCLKYNLSFTSSEKIFKQNKLGVDDVLVNVDDEKLFFLNKFTNKFQIFLKILNKTNGQLISSISLDNGYLLPNCSKNYYKYTAFDDKNNVFIFFDACIRVYDSNGKFLFKKDDDSIDKFSISTTSSCFFYLLEKQKIKSYDLHFNFF